MEKEIILHKMLVDTFLAVDLIPPFENRRIEHTENEKDEFRQAMLQALYTDKKLPN